MKVNLVLLKSGGINKAFFLPSSVTVVGRRQDCDLCIPLMVVSRRHCAFDMDEGKLSIRDLGSSNGTFVNGKRVDETELSPGDKVTLGPLNFIIQINGVPADIEGEQLSASPSDGRMKVDTENADVVASPESLPSQPDMHSTEITNVPTG